MGLKPIIVLSKMLLTSSNETEKPEVPCHIRCGTMKIPPLLKGCQFAAFTMMMSVYKRYKYPRAENKQKSINQTNTEKE